MLKHDIIEKSGGAWASNVVLVLKKGEKDMDGNETGSLRYTLKSFGLDNAPSQFQRLMSLVLAGVLWRTCLVYTDDIVLMAKSVEEMAERPEEVLGRLREANLKLKLAKCRVFQTEIVFGPPYRQGGDFPRSREDAGSAGVARSKKCQRYDLPWQWRLIIANSSRTFQIQPHLFMNSREKGSPSCGMSVGNELLSN